jgi:integrase
MAHGGVGMSIDLRAAAVEHLRARRARGYQTTDHTWLISAFLDRLTAQGTTTITVADVLAFATAPAGTQPGWHAARLWAIRLFAAHVRTLDPTAAEVIPAGLITAKYVRRIPYLYSDIQITELVSRSAALRPPLLGAGLSTFVALIAVTGLRGGEAAGLDDADFDPTGPCCTTGKYGRRRLPLHPSTVRR